MDLAAAIRRYYRTITPLYDDETAGRGDLPFWLALDDAWRPKRVLDVGCGSGRIAVPLASRVARRDATVTGLDLSPDLLRLACDKWSRERADLPTAALSLFRGDMRYTACGCDFDFIFLANDPLTHLRADDDLANTFRQLGTELKMGGHLAIEASLVPPQARGHKKTVIVHGGHTCATSTGRMHVGYTSAVDPVRNVANVVYRYTPVDCTTFVPLEARFVARYVELDEIMALFALAGCRVEERWSDFCFHRLEPDSGIAVITGTRR
jgi:SAM-dependent methyltransferase